MKQYMTVSGLTKYYGDQLIFQDASFSIHEHQKIVLVGPNGTGKSTLLKIIAGIDSADTGGINATTATTIGYADQHAAFTEDESVYDVMLAVIEKDLEILIEIQAIEKLFATTEYGTEAFDKLSVRYEAIQLEANQKGIYQLETKIKMLLTRFGFTQDMWERSVLTLSGGQQVRLHLARLLLQEPDILLLDEPTNHLDIETIIWLDSYLSSYPKALVLISHDEKLLTSLANQVWQIISFSLITYNGTYPNYKLYLTEHIAFLNKQQQALVDEREKLTDFIAKNKARASTANRAQSAAKKLNKLEDVKQLKVATTLKPFSLPINRTSGKFIFKLNNTAIGYTFPLYEPLTLEVIRYERIALVGKNGIGKSTLLSTLAQQIPPLSGIFEIGHHVDVAYFQQQQVFAENSISVYDTFANVYPDANREIIYPILARFGFPQEDVHMNNTTLSGGEKQRLLLALLYFQKANTLLLDEPTNHLDLQSKQALIHSLLQFDGTLIFASHDRDFIEHVATKILFFHAGEVVSFNSYADFENYSSQSNNLEKATDTPVKDAQAQRLEQKEQQMIIRRLQTKATTLEENVDILEKELQSLDALLFQEEIYSDFQKSKEVADKKATCEAEITTLMEQWELVQTELSLITTNSEN